MNLCEVCGKKADKHHIIYKSQGGIDYPLNYKYLCPNHHRGKHGPHKNIKIDLEYKLELQNKLTDILNNEYYSAEDLAVILDISRSRLKKILRYSKLYKEGYKSSDVIYILMGRRIYDEYMLEDLELESLLANF
ncbi:HNH endonuclease [Clostridium polynesiense]|uniref:HNH endonuclease n=1 Tax=Clostridium polynesiense TaxID=1325933 RepID=UPI00058EBAA1|nr:HNH endonuclease signature motif containing protein [Clostridium polynesiense]